MAIQTVKTGAAVNDGTGDDARTAFTKINQNFADVNNAASRIVGLNKDNVLAVGMFGVGTVAPVINSSANSSKNQFLAIAAVDASDTSGTPGYQYGIQVNWIDSSNALQLLTGLYGTNQIGFRLWDGSNNKWSAYKKIWCQINTTTDSNGFIKAASPIVKLFADKIELNDEAAQQKITFEKLGVGDYLIKGSTGFAQEGWYIEMPKDANGNVLVAVVYEQLANNDISVKTYAKMFDPDTGDIVPNTARPRDIPATRWIDLRLQALPQTDIKPFSKDETVATNAE